ncbi:TPA: glycosyltransferase [Providencia rettgeri]
MPQIILAAIATPGHVYPLLTLAKGLIGQGNEITIFTGSFFRQQVEASGANFVCFDSMVDIDHRDLEHHFPERGLYPAGNTQMAQGLIQFFAQPIPVLSKQLMQLIQEKQANLLVIDNTFYAALPLLQQALVKRIPVVAIGVTPLAWPSVDSVFWGARIPPEILPAEITREQLINEEIHLLIENVRAKFSQMVTAAGGLPLKTDQNEALICGVDCYLQLATSVFEFFDTSLPSHVKFIGSLAIKAREDHIQINWKNENQPLIIVTQGTLANVDFNQLLRPTLRALANLPVRVLAITGGRKVDLSEVPLPDNAYLVDYINFEDWLPKASILITNGGYGSVTSAIRHGVPMIMAGIGDGKLEAIARVLRSRCGISLQTDMPSDEQILNAVTEMLSTPLWHQQAKIMQEANQQYNTLELALHYINKLLY